MYNFYSCRSTEQVGGHLNYEETLGMYKTPVCVRGGGFKKKKTKKQTLSQISQVFECNDLFQSPLLKPDCEQA